MPHLHIQDRDWLRHARWLTQRISNMDGRLKKTNEQQVEQLGIDLASRAQALPDGLPSALAQLSSALNRWLMTLGFQSASWHRVPNVDALPMLGVHRSEGVCLVTARGESPRGWVAQTPDGERNLGEVSDWAFCSVRLGWREQLRLGALGLTLAVLKRHWLPFALILLVTLGLNLLVYLSAVYYDREFDAPLQVIDAHVLALLTLGVSTSIGLTWVLDVMRGLINKHVAQDLDVDLAARVFERMLKVRAGEYRGNADALHTQVQLFESVRLFTHKMVIHLILDVPMSVVFLLLIGQ